MKRKINMICLLATLAAVSGCRLIEERVIYEAPPAQPSSSPQSRPDAGIIERRFTTDTTEADAVQSAVTWAKKYEQMVEQNTELRDKHNAMFVKNTDLTRRLEQTEAELERTRKELDEATTFLQEMHVELNKWKADVLGFRQEMRQAQKAQLEALGRILLVLGAEPVRPEEVND